MYIQYTYFLYVFFMNKKQYIKRKRHVKDAPQSIQVAYKREKKEPLSPRPKITKEKRFTTLNQMPLIFKNPTVSVFSSNPKKTQGS